MRLFDPRLMHLLTFLTRRSGWLTPLEVSQTFNLDGRRVPPRTVHRWFSVLREKGGFVYYPYPKANLLGLQDVLVRCRGLRNPKILGLLPFSASFSAEVELGDGSSVVSQSYWVPGSALNEFLDFWKAAKELGLVADFRLLKARNTHFIFSPFHEVITPDGKAHLMGPADNRYFELLIRRHLREEFEVNVGEMIAESPLVVPLVVEHIWEHFSSRQVWQVIRSREASFRGYAKGRFTRALRKPGSALRLLQKQWRELMDRFDEVFLQPRVFFDWPSLTNSMFLNFILRAASPDASLKLAIEASRRSIVTAFKPGLDVEGECHVSCFLPVDQFLPVVRLVNQYHKARAPPVIAVQDRPATISLGQVSFCKLDWRLFDPSSLAWRFPGQERIEQLKSLPTDV